MAQAVPHLGTRGVLRPGDPPRAARHVPSHPGRRGFPALVRKAAQPALPRRAGGGDPAPRRIAGGGALGDRQGQAGRGHQALASGMRAQSAHEAGQGYGAKDTVPSTSAAIGERDESRHRFRGQARFRQRPLGAALPGTVPDARPGARGGGSRAERFAGGWSPRLGVLARTGAQGASTGVVAGSQKACNAAAGSVVTSSSGCRSYQWAGKQSV